MSAEDAAGFVIPTHTGDHVVVRRGRVEAGETVVVLGAAGRPGICHGATGRRTWSGVRRTPATGQELLVDGSEPVR